MKKETYIHQLEKIKEQEKNLVEMRNKLREDYIQANKPCNVGDEVEVLFHSGRKAHGIAKDFAIFHDKNVYLSAYSVIENGKEKSKIAYISAPYESIRVINQVNK
jgi:hypothetical protein